LWNKLPIAIKEIKSCLSFKSILKRYLLHYFTLIEFSQICAFSQNNRYRGIYFADYLSAPVRAVGTTYTSVSLSLCVCLSVCVLGQ